MNYAAARTDLTALGYRPIPVIPNEKRPAVADWIDIEPPAGYDNYSVGIRTGQGESPIYAIDIDSPDEDLVHEVRNEIMGRYGETVFRIGQAPKILMVYRSDKAGVTKSKSLKFNGAGHLEILGYGQQFVGYGMHPVTKRPYTWPGLLGDLSNYSADRLPVINSGDFQEILQLFNTAAAGRGFSPEVKKPDPLPAQIEYNAEDPLTASYPIGKNAEELRELVARLDPDCGHDEWVNVGMALHHETEGSAEGFEIFDTWSSVSGKYKPGETRIRWDSFGRYTGQPVTARYLIKQAQADPKQAKNFFDGLDWSVDRFLPQAPELPMVIPRMMPKGIVSLFYSMGGAGKSTMILYLCTRIAAAAKYGLDFFGYPINGGRAVILTAEDPDVILNQRYVSVVEDLAAEFVDTMAGIKSELSKNLFIASTFGHAVQLFKVAADSTLSATGYYTSLVEKLKSIDDLSLVVIDTKTRYSPGEGLGNVTATQEIGFYESIAQETGAHIMLLHHTSKASRNGLVGGEQSYRDASGLFDSVRAAWYLRGLLPEELAAQGAPESSRGEYFLLDNCKNNYVPHCDPLVIRRQGFSYTAGTMAPKLNRTELKEKRAEEALSQLIALMQAERPKEFSKAELMRMSYAADLRERRFKAALAEAIDAELIEQIPGEKKNRYGYLLSEQGRLYGTELI